MFVVRHTIRNNALVKSITMIGVLEPSIRPEAVSRIPFWCDFSFCLLGVLLVCDIGIFPFVDDALAFLLATKYLRCTSAS
jgi:hypothetical protein